MNSIQCLTDKSDYEIYGDFLNFKIDGYWLDEKLEELIPGNMYKGMIPTLLFAMEIDNEKEVVWRRIFPSKGTIVNCPVLMCPDDCDFSCTLIIAEIENRGDTVRWNKLGVDKTTEWEADKVGSSVEWFDCCEVLEFSIAEYQKMLEDFKARLAVDEADYELRRKTLK